MAGETGQQTEVWPWRDGNYRGEGFIEVLVLTGEKAVAVANGQSYEMTFRHGVFGEVDEEIGERTGEKIYTVETRFEVMGKEIVNYGVLVEEGTKFFVKTFVGLWTLEWVTEEEAERLASDGDSILAPTSPYQLEPERQGRLLWLTGRPGLGKSTSAQLLSRDHGYVYYEGDCFFSLRNPYIPANVEGASAAQLKQRKLVGEGAAERGAVVARAGEEWKKWMDNGEWEVAAMEAGYREMCRDIARERARLGGDWAVAGFLHSRTIRDLARLHFTLLVILLSGQSWAQICKLWCWTLGGSSNPPPPIFLS